MRKTVLAVTAFVLVAFAQTAKPVVNSFTDKRDGKTYRIVKIGTQTWMAENLNFKTKGSKCYDSDTSYCAKYGRLYDWADAMKACPSGWHLPSDAEWTQLTDALGGESVAGGKLKASSGWYDDGNGTNESGFSALPGGGGDSSDSFNVDNFGNWWSVTEYDASDAWYRHMYYGGEYVDRGFDYKTFLLSVRCVRD